MKTIFLAFILLLTASCSKRQPGESPQSRLSPDTALAKTAYLLDRFITYVSPGPSGKKQTIIYRVTLLDWRQPIAFSLALVLNSDTVQYYQYEGSAYEWDRNHSFSSRNTDSLSRQDRAYFLSEIERTHLQTIDPEDKDLAYYKENCRNLFKDDLPEDRFSQKQIDTLFAHFWKYYKGKQIPCVAPPGEPPSGGPGLYAFHPDLKRLVRIYTQ